MWPARAAAVAAAARRRRRLEYGSCSSMLGVARELTVVLHAMWQKALGPRLSASYTCTVPFFVTSMSKITRRPARDAASVLRAPDRDRYVALARGCTRAASPTLPARPALRPLRPTGTLVEHFGSSLSGYILLIPWTMPLLCTKYYSVSPLMCTSILHVRFRFSSVPIFTTS